MNWTGTKTAVEAIAILEAEFNKGGIVEMIEGTALKRYAMVRPNKQANELNPVIIGPMADAEYEALLRWHANKWEHLMKDKKFRIWAKRHPIPNADEPNKN